MTLVEFQYHVFLPSKSQFNEKDSMVFIYISYILFFNIYFEKKEL